MSVHPTEPHEVTTAVIGAGYVGLTTAVVLAELGYQVACGESDPAKVATLSAGQPTIVEEGLAEILRSGLDSGRLRFVQGAVPAVQDAQFVFLCVPTPQGADGAADVSFLEAVAVEIGPHLAHGAIVVNKSTVPVGSTHLVERLLERPDVAVVSNPEFLREGTAIHDSLHPDRIVVGADDQGAAARWGACSPPPGAAHRHRRGHGGDHQVRLQRLPGHQAELRERRVQPVRGGGGRRPRRAARHGLRPPHRFRLPAPGTGMGRVVPSQGHPGARLHRRNSRATSSRSCGGPSRPTRPSWPRSRPRSGPRWVARCTAGWSAAWGLTFKARTDDRRDSPAIDILRRLVAEGATVRAFDPTVCAGPVPEFPTGVDILPDAYAACEGAHCAVVLTEWEELRWLDFPKVRDLLAEPSVVDARNLLDPAAMRRMGFTYIGVGRP